MARSRVTIKSNWTLVEKGAREGLEEAAKAWADTGYDAARETLTKKEASRGYFLNTLFENITSGVWNHGKGDVGAKFYIRGSGGTRSLNSDIKAGGSQADTFYARWFEYGTVHIEPMPFMRPAKTKADKAFKAKAGTSVERAIGRRARVRK